MRNLAAALLVWLILGGLGYMIYLGVVGQTESREREDLRKAMQELHKR